MFVYVSQGQAILIPVHMLDHASMYDTKLSDSDQDHFSDQHLSSTLRNRWS
jgi:hypothetical protein